MHTDLQQTEVNKQLLSALYNIAFHNKQIKRGSLVVLYTREDISIPLKEYAKVEDEVAVFDAGSAFFSLIYINKASSFAHDFIKDFHHYCISNIKSVYHFDDLPESQHHLFNYINSFLFEIEDKKYYMGK